MRSPRIDQANAIHIKIALARGLDQPTVAFVNNLMTAKVNYSFTTNMFIDALSQYDEVTKQFNANVRFNLIHHPLSDFFVVYNEQQDTDGRTPAGRGLVVDCRSSTYAAAWTPTGQLASRWVQVHVPGATHMAKHTRGLVAAAICELESEPRTPAALASMLAASGRFEVSLAEPARPGRPWTLSTTPA